MEPIDTSTRLKNYCRTGPRANSDVCDEFRVAVSAASETAACRFHQDSTPPCSIYVQIDEDDPVKLPPPFTETLKRSPLALVACQLRYSELSRQITSARVADFRNSLSSAGYQYPKVETLKVQSVTFNIAGNTTAQNNSSDGWRLCSADGRWIVTFTSENVTLETTRYKSWEQDFAPRMLSLLERFAKDFKPSVESRLGLRYVDLISIGEVRELSKWRGVISDPLLGPLLDPALQDGIQVAQQQMTLSVSEDVIAVIRHGPYQDQAKDNSFSYLLDTDVFRETFLPFDLQNIAAGMETLHDTSVSLFAHFTTDEYRSSIKE